MRTMTFRREGYRFYCANGKDEIAPEDFDACMKVLEEAAADGKPMTMLVRTQGAAPSGLQRGRFHKAVKSGQLTVAVLTDSMFARGVITAFGWTGAIKVRGFSPQDVAKAIASLGWTDVPPAHAQKILDALTAEMLA